MLGLAALTVITLGSLGRAIGDVFSGIVNNI
jgi:hypothetical protein